MEESPSVDEPEAEPLTDLADSAVVVEVLAVVEDEVSDLVVHGSLLRGMGWEPYGVTRWSSTREQGAATPGHPTDLGGHPTS